MNEISLKNFELLKNACRARAPSNIALVKYWGKRDSEQQWPANDSLSMTLSTAYTDTLAAVGSGTDQVQRGGALASDATVERALRHLQYLRKQTGFSAPIVIGSDNTFPASAGIASSASGFAALTIAALGAWTGAPNMASLDQMGWGRDRLAHMARMGSGSAGRSLFGGFAHWSAGASASEQAVFAPFDASHWPLSDLIFVFHSGPKTVSSSKAHAWAQSSPLFQIRLAGLPSRLQRTLSAIKRRDILGLGIEIEAEALEMHAVMMTSSPSVCYISSETSQFIAALRAKRDSEALPCWFTLDAGPNVHVICETAHEQAVYDALAPVAGECFAQKAGGSGGREGTGHERQKLTILRDHIGSGPTLTPLMHPNLTNTHSHS